VKEPVTSNYILYAAGEADQENHFNGKTYPLRIPFGLPCSPSSVVVHLVRLGRFIKGANYLQNLIRFSNGGRAAAARVAVCRFRRSGAISPRLQLSVRDRISDATSGRARGAPEQRLSRPGTPETDGTGGQVSKLPSVSLLAGMHALGPLPVIDRNTQR